MIGALGQWSKHAHGHPGVHGRLPAPLFEPRGRDVMRAGEGGEQAPGLQEAERAEVDLLVAARGRVQGVLPTGERRGIEDDEAKAGPVSLEEAQLVEGIRLDELGAIGRRVELQVRPRPGQDGRRTLDASGARRPGGERLNREGARVREGVEHRPSAGVSRDQESVLGLVQIEAGLVAFAQPDHESAVAFAHLHHRRARPVEPAPFGFEPLDPSRHRIVVPVDRQIAERFAEAGGDPGHRA
jgi:hypothetical protein